MTDNAPIDEEPTDDGSPPGDADHARDARWVRAARAGDPEAFGHLYDAWFDRAFHLVNRIVRDRETAQEVCQDTFLAAWRGLDGLEDEAAFGGWLLRIARNAAYNRSAREARSRPVDDQVFAVIERTSASPASAPAGFELRSRLARADDPLAAVADAEIAGLVREAAAALGDRDAEVLDLQLRFELTPAEVGEVIGLNRNAANQLCHRVRGRFATAFRARLLWQGARPGCPDLAAVLAAAGVDAFGPEAVALADRHARSCDVCDERRRIALEPAALFGAMPVLAAPLAIKQQVAAALTSQGVPMSGSEAAAVPPGSASPGGGDAHPGPPRGTASGDGTAELGLTNRAAVSRVGRRARVLVAAVAAVVALAAAVVLLRPESDSAPVAATGPIATTTTGVALTSPVAPAETTPTAPLVVRGDATAPVTDAPATGPETTGPAATTTTTSLQPAVIEQFELAPADPQPTTYEMGPTAPTLRWDVSGATDVRVSMWFDDGSGPQPRRLVSTDPTGTLQVCPGTRPTPSTCQTMAGTYSFIVEATGADGTTVTSGEADAPSFDVYVVIT